MMFEKNVDGWEWMVDGQNHDRPLGTVSGHG
jgi:hypothetical protein